MRRHWTVKNNSLELDAMPFYWRMTHDQQRPEGIPARLPIRIEADSEFDYLRFRFNDAEWGAIDLAYQQDQTIGFINPDMGQMDTYGASVNGFVLNTLKNLVLTWFMKLVVEQVSPLNTLKKMDAELSE